jgi:predicted permease
MSWFSIFGFWRRKQELHDEIDAHLQMAIADRAARGESKEAARRAALREFGNVALVQDVTREAWGWTRLEWLAQDFRYTLRQIRRSPSFAATIVGTLGLGIAAAAAMFTVVDHVLLQPTPYRDADRLVAIQESNGSSTYTWPSPWLDIERWEEQSRSISEIAFSAKLSGRNFLSEQTAGTEIDGERISPNLFRVLGIQAILGHGLIPEAPSSVSGKNAGTIVLSDTVWKEVFGGDRGILGRVVKVNGDSYAVSGVMPPGFRYPESPGVTPQVWFPIQLGNDDQSRSFKAMQYTVLGRLAQNATVKGANTEMALIQKRVATEYTDADLRKDHSVVRVERYADSLVTHDVQTALLALLAASGVLWLIAVVNATNLLLARSTVRQREIAMRGALGASRWRVIQQMIVEGIVLSAIAAAFGIGLALGSVRLLAIELSHTLPVPAPATPDGWVVLVLVLLTVSSALLSTTWPAFQAARTPIEVALRGGGVQSGTIRQHHRARGVLVMAEVAMSLTLLVVCGLLLRSIYSLRQVPLGFRTDHILVANLSIPAYRFEGQNMTETLYRPLMERAQHLHGVESAGLISEVPLGKTFVIHLKMKLSSSTIVAFMKAVSPETQKVFGFQMAAGRFFGPEDTANSEPVVVVNEAFARLYSPDKHNPAAVLGAQLSMKSPLRIIGILDDERQKAVADPATPEVEIPIPQITPANGFYGPTEGIAMDLAVRTERPTAEMIPELRDVLRQASPELQNATITTMDQIVEDSYGSQRLAAHLLEIFGGSALLLSVAGLYGLLAYVVTQRTREMGLRIALGAQRSNLLWLVMRQAGAMLLTGLAVGTGLALAAGRFARGFLYGVSAHDGWTLAAAVVFLFASGMAAAYLPARRAARINPMEALRAE